MSNIIQIATPANVDKPAPVSAEPEDYLTIIEAAELLDTMITGRKVTPAAVRGYADRDTLPFFKDIATGKRLIARNDLIFFYKRQAAHAARVATNAINKKAGL